jgi:hypothetical protein
MRSMANSLNCHFGSELIHLRDVIFLLLLKQDIESFNLYLYIEQYHDQG